MEKKILDVQGDRYPFTVPDGYFENLTARIMQQIPQEKEENKRAKVVDIRQGHRRRTWFSVVSVAASFALIAAVTLKFLPQPVNHTHGTELTAEYTDDDYNEDLLTYTMADHIDVYDYLSGEMEE